MAVLGGNRAEDGNWRAVVPVRLTGSRSGSEAFVLGAALRAAVATPYRVGVAVTWAGPRSWRIDVTPGPSADDGLAASAADAIDDDYRAASTVYVDFDEDERGRRIATVVAEPTAEPFAQPRPAEPLDIGPDYELTDAEREALRLAGIDVDDLTGPYRPPPPTPDYEVTDVHERADLVDRAEAGAAVAVDLSRQFAAALGAVSAPPSRAEDAATAAGLAGPAPDPDPEWLAGPSHVAMLRTLLLPSELVGALGEVPFARQDAPESNGPAVFVLDDSGHASGQVVTATIAGDDAPGTTMLVSYLLDGSGDAVTDAVVATRAKACVETIVGAVLRRDRFAVRDDDSSGEVRGD